MTMEIVAASMCIALFIEFVLFSTATFLPACGQAESFA